MPGKPRNFGGILTLLLLALYMAGPVRAGTQIDVGLGENRFFVGEHFMITFKDVAYWITGICMGLIFGTTFLFVTDFDGTLTAAQGMLAKNRNSSKIKGEDGLPVPDGKREARLIGSRKYPTHLEERILKAVHTEPENYVQGEGTNTRQARKIGGRNRPLGLGMEDRVLPRVADKVGNDFEKEENQEVVAPEEDAPPSAAARLLKILFSLPESFQDSTNQEDDTVENKFF